MRLFGRNVMSLQSKLRRKCTDHQAVMEERTNRDMQWFVFFPPEV